jgi:cytochrome c553
MAKILVSILCFVSLTSCQAAQPVLIGTTSASSSGLTGKVKAGFDMAEALCSGCHAINLGEISPNPESPTFMLIARTPNLDEQSLRDWLRDIHNSPEKMSFEIAEDDVDNLAAYIITLRDDN